LESIRYPVDSRRALVPIEMLFLIDRGHKTGYAIRKAFKLKYGINVSFGTIYPMLHSLYRGGYLSKKMFPEKGTKIYSLTRKGSRWLSFNASFIKELSGDLNHRNNGRLERAPPGKLLN
jgi:DNA-binding PadR family transcriptional regulator